ncbi:MAG: right-handed parallel beta-helix repeat-containing protein [Saprospiraceae bacterium]
MPKSLLFAVLICFSNLGASAQCLSGDYILGPAGDFPSFQAACSALETQGVCGPVTIHVQAGNYEERVFLGAIPGVSVVTPVVFRGADSVAFNTTLSFYFEYNFSGPAQILQLAETAHVRFENLSFDQKGPAFEANCVEMADGTHDITFRKCWFWHIPHATQSINAIGIWAHGLGLQNLRVEDCDIFGFATGIHVEGPAGDPVEDVQLKNNTVRDCPYRHAYLINCAAPLIQSNDFSKGNAFFLYDPWVTLEGGIGGRLEKNQFLSASYVGGHLLFLSAQASTLAMPCEVVNNFFYGSNNNAFGLELGGEVNFAYNTVRTGTGINLSTLSNTLHVLNNLFNVSQYVYSLAGTAGLGFLHSDYNVFFPQIADDITGNDFPTLAEWQAASGQDAHSAVKQVAFTGQYPGWQTIPPDPVLDGKALALPFVTDDFGGEARDPVSPDIGADEFSIPSRNVTVSEALVDAPNSPGCAGEAVGFSLKIANNGADTVQSMRIAVWLAGQAFDTLDWQGSLPPEAGIPKMVALGYLAPPAHKVQFTFTVLTVNGLADAKPDDNSAETGPVRIGIKGTFHVNGLAGDFRDLEEVADTLADRGVCGETVFVLDPGRYFGPSVKLINIRGASALNRIVFSSAAANREAVVVELKDFSNPNPVDNQFELINTPGVTFRNLTFFHFYSNYTVNFIAATGSTDLVVENCSFLNTGGNALWLNGNISGLTVSHCAFQIPQGSIYHENAFWVTSHNVRIEDNHFGKGDFNFYLPVELKSVDGFALRRNYLDGVAQFRDCRNGVIADNRIASLYTYFCTNLVLTNNLFVNSLYGSAVSLDDNIHSSVTLLHNTIIGQGIVPALNIATDTLIFQNNIVANYGMAKAIELNPYTRISSQNNLFFAAQSPYMIWSGYGFDAYTTDSLWRKVWKMDTLSVFADPLLAEKNAWLPQNDTATANRGANLLSLVPQDFEGHDRDVQPDLGAVEFSGQLSDLQVELEDGTGGGTCHGQPLVRVRIHNLSGATVHRFEAGWTVNDTLQATYSWSGALAPGAVTGWLELGYYFFRYEGDSLKIWTTYSTESNYANDTLLLLNHSRPLGGTYTVGGDGTDFPQFEALDEAINTMGTCDSCVFLLSTGQHSGHFRLRDIKGGQPVLVRSTAGNRDSVILSHGTFTGFEAMSLQGTDHVTLQSMTLQKGDYSGVVISAWGLDEAVHNAVIDCVLPEGISLQCDTNLVEGCLFPGSVLRAEGGFVGWFYDTLSFLTIRNNVFEPTIPLVTDDPVPVYLSDQRYLKLEGNYFHEGRPLLGERWGIGCEVTGNTFDNNPFGLDIDTWTATPASLLVANNFFWIDTSAAQGAAGLVNIIGKNIRFLHNTVWANFNSEVSNFRKSCALYIHGSSIVFQNNLIHTTGTIVALSLDTAGLSSDYNNFHTTSGWIYLDYTPNANLPLGQWQSGFGQDLHSSMFQPRFVFEDLGGGHDLHLSPDNPFLVRSENPLNEVPTDIDGEARDFFEPCTGADERDGPNLSDFMWPGDANRDKKVSNKDFLFVGLGTGLQLGGPTRSDTSIDWSPKASADWIGEIAGVNAKNIDSDGNGAISAADTLAVIQNFSLEHFLAPPPESDLSALQLSIANPPQQVVAGQALALEVLLTDPDSGPISLHGLAFTLSADENAIVAGSLRFVPASNGWLGAAGQDLWETVLATSNPGVLQVALTRHDGQNATGGGLLGHILCTVADAAGSSLAISLSSNLALQNDGSMLLVGGASQSWPILVATQEAIPLSRLILYPIPADQVVWVTHGTASLLRLYDAFGRVVLEKTVRGEQTALNRENLPGGVYWLEAWEEGRKVGTGKVVWR